MELSINFPYLGIYLDQVRSTVTIAGYEFTLYGILIACSMLLATAYILVWAKRTRQNPNDYLWLVILSGSGAVLGGRLAYIVFYPELIRENISLIWKVWDGGFSLYGAILGGIIFGWLFSLLRKKSFGLLADTACMGILLIQIAGRIGNFFNRECFGTYTENPLAMQIPVSMVRDAEITPLMRENLVMIDSIPYVQVHPTFLYEAIWCLLLFFFLMWYRRRRLFSGEMFLIYLLGYSLGRAVIEEFRTDPLLIPGIGRSVSQLTAAVFVILCFLLVAGGRSMARKRKEARKRMQEAKYQAEEKAGEEFDVSFLKEQEEEGALDVDALLRDE